MPAATATAAGHAPTPETQEKQLVPDMAEEAHGQNLIDSFTGLMVAVIVGGAVAIPVIQDVLDANNFSGTTATVLSFVPLGVGVSLFLASLAPIRGR